MKKLLLLLICTVLFLSAFSQSRPINRLTMQTTYCMVDINKTLRDFVDEQNRENYYNDDFFNNMLKDVLEDQRFTAYEKVHIFYLMLRKLGYSFVGVNFIPPKQNYYIFHLSKVMVLEKTRDLLSTSGIDEKPFLQLADESKTNDPIVSSNALLLASLINPAKTTPLLRKLSQLTQLQRSKNQGIINHYICLAASINPDSVVSANIKNNIFTFKQEGMIEDALCAYYAKQNPLTAIKDYVLHETNQLNDLAIETALCALYSKVSDAAFKQNVKSMATAATEPWKKELLEKIATDKIPYHYGLTSEEQLTPKAWDGVQMSLYTDGTLISNNTLLEFEPH